MLWMLDETNADFRFRNSELKSKIANFDDRKVVTGNNLWEM